LGYKEFVADVMQGRVEDAFVTFSVYQGVCNTPLRLLLQQLKQKCDPLGVAVATGGGRGPHH